MTKLIIVEGLPGSGKSTATKIIYNILRQKGIDVELFSEGDYNHPADFEGVAYFSRDDFYKLKHKYLSEGDTLDNAMEEKEDGYLLPYREAIEEKQVVFEEKLLVDIMSNDIYELPLALHTELIMSRWKAFVDYYSNCNKVIIFECCFIQNPVTVTMIRDGADKEITKTYIGKLADIIKELKPLLIYIEQDSIDGSFRKAMSERPEEWFKGFESYYTNQGYGVNNNLEGVEGVIKILEERNGLERQVYDLLELDKYRVNNTQFELGDLEKKIGEILKGYF